MICQEMTSLTKIGNLYFLSSEFLLYPSFILPIYRPIHPLFILFLDRELASAKKNIFRVKFTPCFDWKASNIVSGAFSSKDSKFTHIRSLSFHPSLPFNWKFISILLSHCLHFCWDAGKKENEIDSLHDCRQSLSLFLNILMEPYQKYDHLFFPPHRQTSMPSLSKEYFC